MNRPRKKNRHLPAKMYFKHGRHWFVEGGKWHQLSPDLGAALREYADKVEKPAGGCGSLISAAFTAMKARVGDAKLSENTIAQYDIAARRLGRILEAFAPHQVKPKHAAAIKVELAKTPNMCNRILSFGRAVFDYGLEHQLVEINPFASVRRHREAKRTRLIAWGEWWKIRAVAPRRLQLVMDGLYLTDQRIDDLLELDERDGLEAGIYFKQSKTHTELIVAWNPDLRKWWDECRALNSTSVIKVNFEVKDRPRPLFRAKGKSTRPCYKTVYDQWVRACGVAEVEDANLHDNRAFSATEMKRQAGGGEAGEIAAQQLLGHAERRNTRIYLRWREVPIVQGPSFRQQMDIADISVKK